MLSSGLAAEVVVGRRADACRSGRQLQAWVVVDGWPVSLGALAVPPV
jgi:hypothetical protein